MRESIAELLLRAARALRQTLEDSLSDFAVAAIVAEQRSAF